MKRTRVETESDENKRVDGRGRSFGPPFLRSSSFLFFFKKVFEFCGSCSSLFSFFFSLFFFFFSPLLLLFSRVCSAPEFYVARVIKLFFLSFFLSERGVFLKNEREERERGNETEYCVSH